MSTRTRATVSCAALCILAQPMAAGENPALPAPGRFGVTKGIHALVVKKSKADAALKAYTEAVPKAGGASIALLPVVGGTFTLGSPDGEQGRNPDEGPQKKVTVRPFWMSKHEITWKTYNAFYQNGKARNKDGTLVKPPGGDDLAALVCQPTPQYHDMFLNGSFANGEDFPAMDMTHHAASKFCQWLSAQTGHFYRLPTEAEWEYACRAGTTTRWSFGDDASKLGDYAWYEDNSNFTYQKVGLKKPNPWGFHDMHGNVAEWVLDQYAPAYYKTLKDGAAHPWNAPVTRYPRVVRGGSWDSPAAGTRSAARLSSGKTWKNEDPQVPKSVWYHTGAQHVGFRIVRPLQIPTAEQMHRYWNTDWWSQQRNAEDL